MINVTDYTIKYTKAGDPIPVVNGVHLHSIYNPQKEAETYLEKNKQIVDEKDLLLILGLGFGYHLNQITNYLEEKKLKRSIMIIEPNIKVFRDYLKVINFSGISNEDSNNEAIKLTNEITCYAGYGAQSLYEDKTFIQFLCGKPGILHHPVSLNLYQEFFKCFLKYTAPKDIKSISKNSKHSFIKNGLSFSQDNSTWDTLKDANKTSTRENIKFEFLLKSFEALN